MAFIDKNIAAMSMPKALNRGNPIPLDASSVYYTYQAMADYAAKNAIAYVGQILSLVDEEKENKVTAYIIADTKGTLKEVGSSAIGDQKSIVVAEDGTISLKGVAGLDFIKKDPEGGPVLGEDQQPIKVNYQPLMTEAGLVWVIPSETTVEDLGLQIDGLNTRVTKLEGAVGEKKGDGTEATGLFKALDDLTAAHAADKQTLEESLAQKLDLAGGTLTGDLMLADGFKAASEKVVDTKVAAAIQSAGHLKRQIVESLPSTSDANEDTIYMVKNSLSLSNDSYDEYMLIDGAFEIIGNTRVDLSNYVEKVEGATENNLAALTADGALIDAGIGMQAVTTHLANKVVHITAQERTSWTEGATKATQNAAELAALVKITQEEKDKLTKLPAITQIGKNLKLEDGVLNAEAEPYQLPVATAEVLGGVKVGNGLAATEDGVLTVNVAAGNGLTLQPNGVTMALATKDANGAMSKEQFVKLANLPANAAANKVEGLVLGANEVAAEIDENKNIKLPFASADVPGVVVSSEEDNHVAVDGATGKMSLNRVSVEKLFVAPGTELVLNGGNSAKNQ